MPGVRQESGGNRVMGLEEIKNQLKELSENGTQLSITDKGNDEWNCAKTVYNLKSHKIGICGIYDKLNYTQNISLTNS